MTNLELLITPKSSLSQTRDIPKILTPYIQLEDDNSKRDKLSFIFHNPHFTIQRLLNFPTLLPHRSQEELSVSYNDCISCVRIGTCCTHPVRWILDRLCIGTMRLRVSMGASAIALITQGQKLKLTYTKPNLSTRRLIVQS